MSGRNSGRNPRPIKRENGSAFSLESLQQTQPSSKKARFDTRNPSALKADAPEEDAILELDEIGRGQQTKRNAVNIDGYDSDSSNDNFEERAEEKARATKTQQKSKDADENDMFADLDEPDGDEDEELRAEGKKKKDVKFMDADEIEGQVDSSKGGGHVSADFSLDPKGKGKAVDDDAESSSDTGDDEERDYVESDEDAQEIGAGGKKKHAPKLDAFNMKGEAEEGKFDESGNFIRYAADADAVHDSWLDGLNKKDIKRAKEAQKKRDEERRARDAADDAVATSDILAALITRLQRGETVLEALQRLNKGRKQEKKKPRWQKNKPKNSHSNGDEMDVDTEQAEDPVEVARKEAIDAITGAADQLLTRGDAEVYDKERELLIRLYKRETGEDWKEPEAANDNDLPEPVQVTEHKQWLYHWADGRDGGQIHGPYDGPTMEAWSKAGYFGEGVEYRQPGDADWSRSVEFVST